MAPLKPLMFGSSLTHKGSDGGCLNVEWEKCPSTGTVPEHDTSVYGRCAWINRLRDSRWEGCTRVFAVSSESLSKN